MGSRILQGDRVILKYPRVLIVLMTKVKADDPGNMLIRTQFGDWPKDNLAQIHAAADTPGHGEFCGRYYRLDATDRALGGLFLRLRGGVFDMVAMDTVQGQTHARPSGAPGRWIKALKKRLGDWLINSGLWELIFRVRLSGSMAKFVEEFKPDLIYCQGYSLGFATLPLLIGKRFSIPICFQTTDDWPSYTYRGFPMGWLLRRRARQLVTAAKVRMAFGEKMRAKYEGRYGVRFEATYHLDDPHRFPRDTGIAAENIRIVYTGSIGLRRYEGIQDLLAVVRTLDDCIRPLKILIYCTGLPKDTPHELYDAPEVEFLPLPSHDELPRILASASVLFLPESFTVAAEQIEYAISSKAHLYMMSCRPILVYGPVSCGTVEYSLREGWGLAVEERSAAKLKDALVEILAGGGRIQQLQRNAEACIQRNHDLTAGRDWFRELLAAAACAGSVPCQKMGQDA